MKNKRIFTCFITWLIILVAFADSGIYICGHFRRERTNTISSLKESGYAFGILFNVHVEEDGTLTTDGEVICKNGIYVFDKIVDGYANNKAQINYVDDVNSLLTGNTSILRLEHCIGGWGNYAYKNITNLVKKEGTGVNSILYKNFKALKDAIPSVIAINNDIEHEYEADTQSEFHIMLYDIGFKTTIAPYTNKSYWDSFVSKVQAARPGAVDRNYLQCYGGGAGNNPKNWKIGDLPIYGSRDIEANSYSSQQIVETMTKWKNDAGIVGGFYWNYNYNRNLKSEAAPINEVFGGGEIVYRDQIVAMVYPVKDYKAPQTDLHMGNYTSAKIKEIGFDINKLAGFKLKEGIKIILYTEDNFAGDSFTINKNIPDINILTKGQVINSWKVIANHIEELNGKEFVLTNKQSNFVLKPMRNTTTQSIQQMKPDGSDYMVWIFEAVQDGLYKIINKGSRYALQTNSSNTNAHVHDGLSITQGPYKAEERQHFIVQYSEAEQSYKLISLSSLKYIGVSDASQTTANAYIVQRRSSSAPSTNWLLQVPDLSNVSNPYKKALFNVYPRNICNDIYIESEQPDFTVEIIDMSGRTLTKIDNSANKVDVSSLTKGVYTLVINTGTKSIPFKIIK